MMVSLRAPSTSDGRTEDSMISSSARLASSVGLILSSSARMVSRILSRIWFQLRRGSADGSCVMVSSIIRSTLQGKISPALLTEQRAVFCNNDGLVADEVND